MKRLDTPTDIKKAAELSQVIAMRRLLDKQEAELKKHFKEKLGDSETLLVGNSWLITLDTQQRTYLDKEKLETFLGDSIHGYEIVQTVKILKIKNAKE